MQIPRNARLKTTRINPVGNRLGNSLTVFHHVSDDIANERRNASIIVGQKGTPIQNYWLSTRRRLRLRRAHLSGVPVLGRTRSLDWKAPILASLRERGACFLGQACGDHAPERRLSREDREEAGAAWRHHSRTRRQGRFGIVCCPNRRPSVERSPESAERLRMSSSVCIDTKRLVVSPILLLLQRENRGVTARLLSWGYASEAWVLLCGRCFWAAARISRHSWDVRSTLVISATKPENLGRGKRPVNSRQVRTNRGQDVVAAAHFFSPRLV